MAAEISDFFHKKDHVTYFNTRLKITPDYIRPTVVLKISIWNLGILLVTRRFVNSIMHSETMFWSLITF